MRNRLEILIQHPHERERVGTANQAKARSEYSDKAMIAAYASLYSEAMGRPGALTP